MGIKTRKLSKINDSLIEWQSVVVADGSTGLTAVAGRGYFINTTAGAITITLPSATAKPGDVIQLKDYARTWGTNAVSIASNTFDGFTNNPSFSTNGQTVTLVYMDNTKGWSLINEDTTSTLGAEFISATGGTITTSGDFKIHTFTGDGSFVVSTLGNPSGGGSVVDYLVVAGAGGGGPGCGAGAGGGAGGMRASATTYTNDGPSSPRTSGVPGITVTITTYPITVGGGGPGGTGVSPAVSASNGSPSIFSTITSTGGGKGGSGFVPLGKGGNPGGSGGGSTRNAGPGSEGTGNTPPVSPSQGSNGGNDTTSLGGGGGGGALSAGTDSATPPGYGGNGGAGGGFPNAFGTSGQSSGGYYYFSGGGGGGNYAGATDTLQPTSFAQGGLGGGGKGALSPSPSAPNVQSGSAGTANTGGGGGGAGEGPASGTPSFDGDGGNGGKGIVIIRYKYQ